LESKQEQGSSFKSTSNSGSNVQPIWSNQSCPTLIKAALVADSSEGLSFANQFGQREECSMSTHVNDMIKNFSFNEEKIHALSDNYLIMQPAFTCDKPSEMLGQLVNSPEVQREIGINGEYQHTLMQYPTPKQNGVANLTPIKVPSESDLFEKLLLFTESNFHDDNSLEPIPLSMVW
jgi:hypothetical protein